MNKEGLGAVVRTGNPYMDPFLPTTNLIRVINYSLARSKQISGSANPELLLCGYSAGASAASALASSYEQVKRILLIAPSGNMPREAVETGLVGFGGEVYIVIGDNDEVVGSRSGEIS